MERLASVEGLSRLKEIAELRGGRCLATRYTNAKDLYPFRCREGHEWQAAANNVTRKNGTWCQKCAGPKRAEVHFERIKEKLRLKRPGAVLLSETYVNKDTDLPIRCERGHFWSGRPQVILRGGWCKRCAAEKNGASQRCSFAVFQRLVRSKGGVLLTGQRDFTGNKTRVRIRCAHRHEWDVTVASVRQQRSWCPRCAGVVVSLEQVRSAALERGGQLLERSYTNARTPMRFTCSAGHAFRLPWNKVQSGRWCPRCSSSRYLGEEACRQFFERAFGTTFPKQKPAWLTGASGKRLELDGFNETLKIAFEHHGDHKFRAGTRFARSESDVAALQARMKEKARICARHDVVLVEVRQVGTVVALDELPRLVIRQLQAQGVRIPARASGVRVTWADVHQRGAAELDRYRQLAYAKEGQLLSTAYLGSSVKLQLRCREGHTWSALPASISKGHWCAACAGRKKGTIEQMRALATERGWRCLSNVYRRASAKLEWQCSRGHTWRNSPAKIKAGQGCPYCSGRRVTIDDCRALAQSFGGECLSRTYLSAVAPMLWRCHNGHKFERSRNRVMNGRWCSCRT